MKHCCDSTWKKKLQSIKTVKKYCFLYEWSPVEILTMTVTLKPIYLILKSSKLLHRRMHSKMHQVNWVRLIPDSFL